MRWPSLALLSLSRRARSFRDGHLRRNWPGMLIGAVIAALLCLAFARIPAAPAPDQPTPGAGTALPAVALTAVTLPAVTLSEMDGRWLGGALRYARLDSEQTVTDFAQAVRLGAVQSVAVTDAIPRFAALDPRPLWIHLRLHNPENAARAVRLELRNASLRAIALYAGPTNSDHNANAFKFESPLRAGTDFPQAALSVPHRHPIFPIELPPGLTDCYLRIDGAAYKKLPLRIFAEPEDFARTHSVEFTLNGMFFGALAGMAALNLLCYLTMRDRSYAALAVFILAWAVTIFLTEGYGRQFFWKDQVWSGNLFGIFNPLASIALIVFLRLFVRTRRHAPILDRFVLSAFVGGYLFAMAVYPFLSFDQRVAFGLQVVLPSGFFMAALAFAFGAIAWWRGYSAGRYHTIAGALFMIVGELGYLEVLGLVPANLISENGGRIGFLAYIVLLTIGTGQRIRQMKDGLQKLNAQRQIAELAPPEPDTSPVQQDPSGSGGPAPAGDAEPGRNEWTITPRTEALLKTTLEQIQQNFREAITRESLAELLGWNQDNLGRFFKMYTGERIGDMINRLRVEAAARDLRDSEDRVTEIAFAVGFDSLKTFNRNFARVMHTTPSEFRKISRLPSGDEKAPEESAP